jgi:hypothetical protein
MTDQSKSDDKAKISGCVVTELWRLNEETGKTELVDRREIHNLVTQYGDQFYGEKAHGIGSHNSVSGMRLGTGTTAAAKTGAGAAIVTHITGSNKALDGAVASSLEGSARRLTFATTWAAGEATNAAIAEAVITNSSPLGTDGGSVGDTLARIVFDPAINKQAGDTLTVTWAHDLLGA